MEAFHTERRPNRPILQHAEAIAIIESFDDGVLILDPKGRVIDVNQQLETLLGYPRRELIGKTALSTARLLTRKGLTLFFQNPFNTITDADPAAHELDVFKKGGDLVTVQIYSRQLKNDSKLVGRLVILKDMTEARRLERESSESAGVYKSLVNQVEVGIFRTTPGGAGRFIQVNHAMEEITGYSHNELMQLNVEDLYVFREERLKHVNDALRCVPAKVKEIRFKKKDGSEITVREKQVAVQSHDGKALFLEGFLEDITDRKRAEEALKASEQNLRSFFDNSVLGIRIRTNGYVEYANQALLDTFGYKDIKELQANPPETMYTPKCRIEFLERKEKISRGEAVANPIEVDVVRKDGSLRHLQVFGRQVIQNGKAQAQTFFNDITDRKQIEAALKASEENFRNSMDSSVMGISIMGENNCTLYANQTLFDMFGYKNIEELRSSPPQEHYTPDSYADFVKRREQFAHGELLPSQLEIEITRKDGAIRHLELLSKIVLWNGEQQYQFIYNDITERVEAEKAVKASQETYSTLIEQSVDGIVMLNKHSIEFANRKMSELFGFSSDEILGKEFVDLVSPIYKDKLIKSYVRELPVGVPNTLELEMVTKDGKGIAVDTRALPIIFKDRPATMVVIRDITEQKVAEAAAKASELNFRNSLDSSSMGIRISDNQENNLYVNQAMLNIFGYRNIDEIKGDPPSNHYAPKDYAEWILRHEKFLRGEPMPKHIEAEIKDKNGIIKNLDISMTEVFWDGRIQFETIYNDVTERKQAEAQLKRAAKEWRTTFDSISDLIMIQDNDHRIIRANKAAADWMKTTPKELVGKLCCEVFRGTKEPQANCPCASALKTGKSVGFENYNPSLGTYLYESHSPIFNDQGEAIGSILVARDITEQKRMEEQLILTDRLASIGELSSGIAHELNNPLTSVIGFSQLIMDGDVPENIREDLSIVNSEAQRAAGIVKNLLTFARKHAPVTELCQINSVIENVLKLRAYEQKVNDIEVEKYLAADLPEIMMDHFQMQQVFLNIIVNAEFAMLEAHKKGKLTVSSEKSANVITVRVTDNGPGISRENLKHIFDPFFTTKEVGKGTGLGLSICHGIVSEHGGQIFATSKLDQGTTFTVELPLHTGETNETG